MTSKDKPVVMQAKALAALLSVEFTVWRNSQPLMLGIVGELHDWIASENLAFSKRCVHYCLRYHVESHSYLSGLTVGKARYSLNGHKNGEVSEKEASYAQTLISHKYSQTQL